MTITGDSEQAAVVSGVLESWLLTSVRLGEDKLVGRGKALVVGGIFAERRWGSR